jgi:hypothetical protein
MRAAALVLQLKGCGASLVKSKKIDFFGKSSEQRRKTRNRRV